MVGPPNNGKNDFLAPPLDIPSTAGTRTGQDCEPAIMVTFQKIRKHVTTNEGHVTWHDPGSPVGRGLVARYRW